MIFPEKSCYVLPSHGKHMRFFLTLVVFLCLISLSCTAGCVSPSADTGGTADHVSGVVDAVAYEAYAVPIPNGKHMVFLTTENGFIGCTAFNLSTFEALGIPAVLVSGVSSVEDLLNAEATDVTVDAASRGIVPGMSCREVISLLG